MARHSHWAQIKLKKGVLDKKRGKIFTRHAHLIEIAARTAGGDPITNAGLRMAIENARADNLPRENIDRAIKKGTGDAKDAVQMHEVTYEGYAPGGIAIIIDAFTDNTNRTNQTIRTIMQKLGGTIGAMGGASFLFEQKGEIMVNKKADRDADELEIIDAGAQDLTTTDDGFCVYTAPEDLAQVRSLLTQKGFKISSSQLVKLAKTPVPVTDVEIAKKILKLIDALEDEDDISNVFTNFEMSEEVMNAASM